MRIDTPTSGEFAGFLDLVDAEIRPDRAKSHAWDDFPVILREENRDGCLVATDRDGALMGGIGSLTRTVTSNCGEIVVAGIGSVVTRAEFRGQGVSAALQNALLDQLRARGVTLAVLWTDQPEIYAGRGFVPAGWEFHLDFQHADLPGPGPGFRIREFVAADVERVQSLYDRHPFRTLREPGDAAALYLMPGTSGLVLEDTAGVQAAVFCGKGADFPDYVAEWDGDPAAVTALLAAARDAGLARRILVPAGEEGFAETLVQAGGAWEIRPSGYWVVLDPEPLAAATGQAAPADADARFWLGGVDEEAGAVPGLVKIGIWGLDSV